MAVLAKPNPTSSSMKVRHYDRLLLSHGETPSLGEALYKRITDIYDSDAWNRDILTGDCVIYFPHSRPRQIRGKIMKGIEVDVLGNESEEVEIGKSLINYLIKNSNGFVDRSVWVHLDFLEKYTLIFGGNKRLVRQYKRDLTNLKINNIQIYPIPKDYVDSRQNPFIRQIRLKGTPINKNNINRGGICADINPLVIRDRFN